MTLFLSEPQIAKEVLGPGHLDEWRKIVSELKGLPPIDPQVGRRYWPAVRAFFDRRYGLGTVAPRKPDGVEKWPQKPTVRASSGAVEQAANVHHIGSRERT